MILHDMKGMEEQPPARKRKRACRQPCARAGIAHSLIIAFMRKGIDAVYM